MTSRHSLKANPPPPPPKVTCKRSLSLQREPITKKQCKLQSPLHLNKSHHHDNKINVEVSAADSNVDQDFKKEQHLHIKEEHLDMEEEEEDHLGIKEKSLDIENGDQDIKYEYSDIKDETIEINEDPLHIEDSENTVWLADLADKAVVSNDNTLQIKKEQQPNGKDLRRLRKGVQKTKRGAPPPTAVPEMEEPPREVIRQLRDAIAEVFSTTDVNTSEGDSITEEEENVDNMLDGPHSSAASGSPTPSPANPKPKRRKKNPCVILPDDTERLLGDWLREDAQFIYNKKYPGHHDRVKVARAFEEKGASLDPPLTGTQLRTWYDSLRSRFGRLTKTMKSGSGASRPPTERESWIMEIFGFIQPYIIRQRKTRTHGLGTAPTHTQTPVAAETHSLEPQASTSTVAPPHPLSPVESSDEVVTPAVEVPLPSVPGTGTQGRSTRPQGDRGGYMDKIMVNQAQTNTMLEKFSASPALVHWRNLLAELAPTCVRVKEVFWPSLSMEFTALVDRYAKLSENTDMMEVPPSLLHHCESRIQEIRARVPPPPPLPPPPPPPPPPPQPQPQINFHNLTLQQQNALLQQLLNQSRSLPSATPLP